MKKKVYKVPVVWSMMGYLRSIASSEQEAVELARKEAETCPLPEDGEYLEDSFELDEDALSYLGEDESESDNCLMSSDVVYQDGYEFYQDLVATYGLDEGKAKALRYLEIPLSSKPEDAEEEKQFRSELKNAMKEGQ